MTAVLAWFAWAWGYAKLIPVRFVVYAVLLFVGFFAGCSCARAAEPDVKFGECWMVGEKLSPAQRRIANEFFAAKGLAPLADPCPVTGNNCNCGCAAGRPCNCAAPDPVKASVRVDVPYTDGSIHSGSGTVVALYKDPNEGKASCVIVTNRHVCPRGGCVIRVLWPDGKFTSDARWLGCDDQADIAALCAYAPDDATACPPAVKPPDNGDELVQVGYPRTRGPVRRVGAALGGCPDFAARIRTDQGDSGSGLFDRRGRLVAVCWGLNLNTGCCTCVNLVDVQRFLLRPATRRLFPELHDVVIPPRVAVQPAPFYPPAFAPFGGGCAGGNCRGR